MTKPNKGKLSKQSKFSKYRDISNSVKVKFGSRKESEPTCESESYDGNEKSDLETLIENMLGLPSTNASYLNRSINEISNLDWAKDSDESIFLMPNRRGFNRLKIDYGAIEREYKAFSADTKSQYRKLFELIDRFEESDLIGFGKKFRIIGYKKESSGQMYYITVPGSRSVEPSVKIFRSLQSIRVVDDFAETFIASNRSERLSHNILSDHWYSALKDCIEISEYDEILDEIDKKIFDIIFSGIKEEKRPSIWSIKSYRPHFGRWFLSSSEISLMIAILGALISMNSSLLDFFKRESSLQISKKGVKGHIPCIVEKPDGKSYYIERVPFDIGVSYAFFSDLVGIDDALVAKIADLSGKPKNLDSKWEIGVNILLNEVQEGGKVPYYPELVLCFDCDLKRCIFNYLGALHLEKGRAEFYQRFVSLLSSLDHLPGTVKVLPEFKSLFAPFKSLFTIEEFKDGDLEIFQKENMHCCEILEELYFSHDIPIEIGGPIKINRDASLSDLVSLDLFYQKHKKNDNHFRVLSDIKRRFPDSGASSFLLGMEQYYNHFDERALEYFEKARELRYAHAEMENAMGILSIRRGDFLGAEPYFHKAISFDSSFADAYYNVAMIKALFRNLLEAEQYLLKAIEYNCKEGLYYLSLAKVMIGPEVQKYRRSIFQIGQKLNSMVFYKSDKNSSFLQKLGQECESIFKLYGPSMADLFKNRVEIYKSISKLVL